MKIIERKQDYKFYIAMFFMAGLTLGFAITDSDNEYTQSDVSAFNIAISKFDVISNGCKWIEPWIHLRHGSEKVFKLNCVYDNYSSKRFEYFPQFDGVKIELESEQCETHGFTCTRESDGSLVRQECWNETKEIFKFVGYEYSLCQYLSRNESRKYDFIKGEVYQYDNLPYPTTMMLCKFYVDTGRDYFIDFMQTTTIRENKVFDDVYNLVHIGKTSYFSNITRIEQKCKTIPAVTKTLSGWAEDENDLATEFCKSKKYVPVPVFADYQSCFDAWDACFYEAVFSLDKTLSNICDKNYLLCRVRLEASKPFTRGEVVDVDTPTPKAEDCPKGITMCLYDLPLKQKLIRCYGDNYQQDFEALKVVE